MSHPIWVCVLKLITSAPLFRKAKSHPIWVCVLKHNPWVDPFYLGTVTPYMGVCIETAVSAVSALASMVTPYMGVCIETYKKNAVH